MSISLTVSGDDVVPSDINTPLRRYHYVSYALPAIAMAWMQAPIVVVQGVYAKYLGLSLTAIASTVLLARIFDAVTDPLIGYYADLYCKRHGTRKPFVVTGGLLMIISSYFLYIPFSDGVVYFGVCLFAFYLAYTVFEVPHQAWASELAVTAADKSNIFSWRNIFVYFGLGIFYAVPLLPIFESTDITLDTLKISVILASACMLLFLLLCAKYTPNGNSNRIQFNGETIEKENSSRLRAFGQFLLLMTQNKPMCLFLVSYLSWGVGGGMWLGLFFLYVDSYVGIGELFSKAFMIGLVAGIAITPVWCKIANRFGKKVAMGLAYCLMSLAFVCTPLLTPGEVGLWELALLNVVYTTGAGCIQAIAPALLSEIIDYNTLKFRSSSTAAFYSIQHFLNKSAMAIGAAFGLAIVGLYGFDATLDQQGAGVDFGFFLAMTLLPTAFLVVALITIVLNPINERRHSIICCRFQARLEGKI